MLGCEFHNKIPMTGNSADGGRNKTAIRRYRKGFDRPLNFARVAHVDWIHLHLVRRRGGLDDTKLPQPGDTAASRKTAARVTWGAISLSNSIHFALKVYSNAMNPVALPPGRARLSTKPAATGSPTAGNTTGTLRVTCSKGRTVEAPAARMTSEASATNSAAYLWALSALPLVQRISIRIL